MDLTAVHDILLKTGYKDEEGAENEVHFNHYALLVWDLFGFFWLQVSFRRNYYTKLRTIWYF